MPPEITRWLDRAQALAARHPRAAVAGTAAAALVVGWLLYVPPWLAVQRESRQWRQLKAATEEARRPIEQLRRHAVPDVPAMSAAPEALARLQAAARAHHLQVVQVTPGPPRPAETPELAWLPVEIQIVGGYRALGEFLGALRQTPGVGTALVRGLHVDRDERLLPDLRAQVSLELAVRGGAHGSS